MAVTLRHPLCRLLSDPVLGEWSGIPTAVISDELNRSAGMSASIAPMSGASRFAGEAVTVHTMVGDNLALHVAAGRAPKGSVIVVNAGGYSRTAGWGEILHTCAEVRGVAAVLIDGGVRDRAVLSKSATPLFACGSAPNGPHKGWGGTINGVIQCGGIAVGPNDLLVGDADGVAVIPRHEIGGLLERCRRRMAGEESVLAKIRAGASSIEALGIDVAVHDTAQQAPAAAAARRP